MASKTKLTGRVIFKGDPGYERARKNWDPHTDRFPKVFVFAQKTQDVANAIKWGRENNVPIRPRSGRHSLEVNLSQVNGGLVIDVSDSKTIKLDKKNKPCPQYTPEVKAIYRGILHQCSGPRHQKFRTGILWSKLP